MKTSTLENMIKGWFVGNFVPTLYQTNKVEVAVKSYNAGAYEATHHHKIATEITVVAVGKVQMNGVTYRAGDIIVMEPNESTDFLAVTDAMTTVVKIPGANDDKYAGSAT